MLKKHLPEMDRPTRDGIGGAVWTQRAPWKVLPRQIPSQGTILQVSALSSKTAASAYKWFPTGQRSALRHGEGVMELDSDLVSTEAEDKL